MLTKNYIIILYMDPAFSPLIVYVIRIYRQNKKLSQEHIFLGNLLDLDTIDSLNTKTIDYETDADIRKLFKEFDIKPSSGITIYYHSILLEYFDTWNDFFLKIKNAINIPDFYLWIYQLPIISHTFYDRNQLIEVDSNPFNPQNKLNKIFENFNSLDITNNLNHIVRNHISEQHNIINLISVKDLKSIHDENTIKRYIPTPLVLNKPYYNMDEAICLTAIMRNENFPRVPQNIKIIKNYVMKTIININNNNHPPFIDLNTLFQLISLDDKIFLAKLKIGEKSISKVSNHISKLTKFFTMADIEEWTKTDKHHIGLVYKKIKENNDFGIIDYTIYNSGFIQLSINWIDDSSNPSEDITQELQVLNVFIKRINSLNFHLPTVDESKSIPLADLNFVDHVTTNTSFYSMDNNLDISTNNQQIIWSRFLHLASTWNQFLNPISVWKIYNKIDIKRIQDSDLAQAHLFYTRTDNNSTPHPLDSVLHSLGLLGTSSIYKEQNIPIEDIKTLVIQNLSTWVNVSEDMTFDQFNALIKTVKESQAGNLITISRHIQPSNYKIVIHNTHNIQEITEGNYIILKLFEFYFHIEQIFQLYIKYPYSCDLLYELLSSRKPLSEQTILSNVPSITNLDE